MPSDPSKRSGFAGDFTIGDYLVQPSIGKVSLGDTVVRLRPQLIDLLVCLGARGGQTVSKDEILDTVWPGQFIAESGLARCIAELRQVFRDSPQQPRFIETIPKRGYRIVAPVRFLGQPDAPVPLAAAVPSPPPLPDRNATSAAPNDAALAALGTERRDERADQLNGPSASPAEALPAVPQGPANDLTAAAPAGSAFKTPTRRVLTRWWILAPLAAAVVLTLVAFVYWQSRKAPALSDRDTVVLTFENTTGDPVFDGALRLALAIQLEQSPYLRILPDQQVADELRYMGRPAQEPLTRDVAMEVCQRAGAKAVLAGSLAMLGSHYVIGLEAASCRSGETLARQQVEVEEKDLVLGGLGQAASDIRRRLGESLSSIRAFDVPIVQATTSSLEALKSVSLGDLERSRGRDAEALRMFTRATELDPDFALAHVRLGVHLLNLNRTGEGLESLTRAFALKERVSTAERLYIRGHYYSRVVRDPFKAIETFETWKQDYPKNPIPRINLGSLYAQTGRFEQAIAECRGALALDSANTQALAVLTEAHMGLNQLGEARRLADDMVVRKMGTANVHAFRFQIAFVLKDIDAMRRELEWADTSPGAESIFLDRDAEVAMFSGKIQEARRLWQRLRDLAAARKDQVLVAISWLKQGIGEALAGQNADARVSVDAALGASRSPAILAQGALVLGLARHTESAERLVGEYDRVVGGRATSDPESLPAALALLESQRNHHEAALKLLEPLRPYESGTRFGFVPTLVRGQVLLAAGRAGEAAKEFDRIIAQRGAVPDSVVYPVACLGLARARTLAGDFAQGRQAYERFLEFWKDADREVPALSQARQELARLR